MPSISTVLVSLALLGTAACASSGKRDATGTSGSGAPPPAATSATQAQATLTPMDLQKSMQKIGPAYGSLLKNLKGDLKAAGSDADTLATEFGNVERFWAQHNKADAVKWAQDARTAASTVAGAAAANDSAKATTAAQSIGGQCKSCHTAYREGTQQTGFSIKAGAI
jgi:hypothetical protein